MEEERKQQQKERDYVSPDFEVVEIEFEQNILGGSGDSDDLDSFGGRDW
jgi:hypothetical protein